MPFIDPKAQPSASEHLSGALQNANQTAKVLSARKVLRCQYFLSRYPQIHSYLLYISFGVVDQTYCTE